ncbi:CbtB domain-containing protein [Nocardioides antri]|uniref:CbtB-domain containing protein n=1 Tax=Nocardioides antri TaxID=2607659 RepID=A0A5B1M0T5_9ACTN|nr:CbtB-domain containing protein [Nocardioides antri]KAA1426361.1 CbtB-domain containing protein [Nocardioides antri]
MAHPSVAPVSGPAIKVPAVEIPTIPLLQLGTWVVFYGLLAMLAIFFVSADQGAISLPAGNAVHEWVHDARHLLGYPCH